MIGGSAGALRPLIAVLRDLPGDFPAAIFVVLHMSHEHRSELPEVLSRAGPLNAQTAKDGERWEAGRIYVARPDYHLKLRPEQTMRLTHGARENRHRPAVDPLFRSAARFYGPRVLAIILSGFLDDGAAGLAAVKRHGGIAVVQEPDDAAYPEMPRAALAATEAEFQLPAGEIAALLVRLANSPRAEGGNGARASNGQRQRPRRAASARELPNGLPSAYACPECHGVLWEVKAGDLAHFRCRTGHAYSQESLASDLSDHAETALWAALRALSERAGLSRRMSRDAIHEATAKRFAEQAAADEANVTVLRKLIAKQEQLPE